MIAESHVGRSLNRNEGPNPQRIDHALQSPATFASAKSRGFTDALRGRGRRARQRIPSIERPRRTPRAPRRAHATEPPPPLLAEAGEEVPAALLDLHVVKVGDVRAQLGVAELAQFERAEPCAHALSHLRKRHALSPGLADEAADELLGRLGRLGLRRTSGLRSLCGIDRRGGRRSGAGRETALRGARSGLAERGTLRRGSLRVAEGPRCRSGGVGSGQGIGLGRSSRGSRIGLLRPLPRGIGRRRDRRLVGVNTRSSVARRALRGPLGFRADGREAGSVRSPSPVRTSSVDAPTESASAPFEARPPREEPMRRGFVAFALSDAAFSRSCPCPAAGSLSVAGASSERSLSATAAKASSERPPDAPSAPAPSPASRTQPPRPTRSPRPSPDRAGGTTSGASAASAPLPERARPRTAQGRLPRRALSPSPRRLAHPRTAHPHARPRTQRQTPCPRPAPRSPSCRPS